MGGSKRHGGKFWSLFFCFLISALLLAAGSGCRGAREAGPGRGGPVKQGREILPEERLLAYEQEGCIWVVRASGEGARKIGRTGSMALGAWAPDGERIAVLTAVERSGEWVTGYAGVLDLKGKVKPVLGPQGPLPLEPGEMAWLPEGDSLVLASLDTIWVAREEGDVFRARVLYTSGKGGNERVWHPRQIPRENRISFWITAGEGEGGRVKARLVTLPAAGGEPEELFSQVIWASGEAPVEALWSPDGRYALIYAEPAGEGSCWWLLDRKSGMKKAVLSPTAGDPQWLPGGESLVYAPQAQLQVPRYEVLHVATGEASPFAEVPGWASWLEVSPDGKKILLAKAAGEDGFKWDLYVAGADAASPKKVASGAGDAAWQP
ncbi:MAG: hypothetical protein HPY58_04685 [Firmicutes bacterium]|nr:hypothetical protein [Bacillota bacterium]